MWGPYSGAHNKVSPTAAAAVRISVRAAFSLRNSVKSERFAERCRHVSLHYQGRFILTITHTSSLSPDVQLQPVSPD